MSFLEFCEFIFRRHGHSIDGHELLRMCEVAYKEIKEEEDAA